MKQGTVKFRIRDETTKRRVCNTWSCKEPATHYVLEDYRGFKALSAYCREDSIRFLWEDEGDVYTGIVPIKHVDVV